MSINTRYVSSSLDDIAIVASMIAIREGDPLSDADQSVLAAFARYSAKTEDPAAVREYLLRLSDDQIPGVVSNVKGILHEMEFVRLENSDGDQVSAALFPNANHEGFDVLLFDKSTGESWPVQLKATDSPEYVQEWITSHSDGEILLSEEIATELGMPSTGLANEELTMQVERFVDELLSRDTAAHLWHLFPTLALVSISLVVIEFYKRYRSGQISLDQFKTMTLKAAGIKTSKFALLMALLAIPVVNVAVGAALVARLLYMLSR